jgi:hypothetical protein
MTGVVRIEIRPQLAEETIDGHHTLIRDEEHPPLVDCSLRVFRARSARTPSR